MLMSSSANTAGPRSRTEKPLSLIPPTSISKILFILCGESETVTITEPTAVESFWLDNMRMPLEYRSDYSCWTMTAEACWPYRTVMVYVTDAEPHSLVVDVESRGLDGNGDSNLPLGGRFVAGPFESKAAAEKFAVDLIIKHGCGKRRDDGRIAFVDKGIESTDESEIYQTDEEFLEAFQSGLLGLEWFHVFPVYRVAPKDV